MLANSNILVTGGASFIGSHIVNALVDKSLNVRVIDNLSAGMLENIRPHIDDNRVEFILADLRDPGVARKAMQGIQLIFHLAADHGGRGVC